MHFKIFLFILVLEHKVFFFSRILKSFQSCAWTKQYFSTGTHSPLERCVTLERRISSEYKSNLTTTLWPLRFQTNVNSSNRYISSLRTAFPRFRLEVCKMKKIENPQALPESRSRWTISRKNILSSIRFLFYANGGKIGFAVLPSASRGPDNYYLNVAWE